MKYNRPGAPPLPLTAHPVQRWYVRAVLALALASPAILFFLSRGLNADRPYTLEVAFASSVDGALQVFYDRGGGITEAESAAGGIKAGHPNVLRLKIPAGTYERFRVDPPGLAGRFEFARIEVRDWDSQLVADIPVSRLTPAAQLSIVSPGPPLVVESPPGSNDPQLALTPATPIVLGRNPTATRPLIVACLAVYVVFCAGLLIAGHLLVSVEALVGAALDAVVQRAAHRPAAAIVGAAIAGTLVVMYPVVFLGASLVTPNNGAAGMLYDQPPFAPGGADRDVEVIRGADNGAAMWAFVPYAHLQRTALQGFELPLWNRFNAAGRPLWGQGQSQLLDPLHWFTLVTDPGLGWDLKFIAHRVTFAAGVGMAVLALTGSWAAAVSMAFVAPFAGYFLFRLNHPAQFSLTYAAWMMWAWFRLAGAVVVRDLARAGRWLAITTAMVLVASPPKEAAVVLLCGYVTGGLACASTAGRVRRLGAAALAAFTGLLLAAPHWLVFVNTLAQALTDYDKPFARFATAPFAVGFAFGALAPGGLLPSTHVVAAATAVSAIVAGRSTWGRGTAIATVTGAALAIAVAFGLVPADVITRTPFFANIYQIDYTFLGAAVVLTLVAGGLGVAGLIAAPPDGARWPLASTLAPLAASAVGAAVLLSYAGGLTALNLYVETWALLLAAVLGSLLVPLVRIAALRWPAPLPVATVVIVALLLVIPNGLQIPTTVGAINELAIQPRARATLAADSPAVRAIHRDAQSPARVVGIGDVLFSGTQGLYGLEGIAGPDALELPKYEALINAAGVQRYWTWNILLTGPDVPRVAPLLDLLNVGYVVVPHRTPSQGLPPGVDNLQPLPIDGNDLVLAARRPTAWPRAFFVDRVERYREVHQFVAQLNQSNGPFASIEDEGGPRIDVPAGEPGAAPDPGTQVEAATNYKLTANRTSFRIRATSSGLAVLSEAWMANDFEATLNGQTVPYLRVNHAFKGVQIPAAGDWVVEFRYRPRLWGVSWALSALGAAALLVARARIG